MGRVERFTETDKWCPKCKAWLPLETFWKDPARLSGRRAFCISCEREKKNSWRGSNRVKIGATPEVIDALWEKQGKVCGLCHKEVDGGKNVAHLDHNHRTGMLRGLVHGRCNWLLGFMKDDPALLRQAADYLEMRG